MYIEVKEDWPIKNLTSFKIGGNISKLYFPKTQQEIIFLLKTLHNPIIVGNWSNVLISSAGITGNVICTSKLCNIEIKGTKVICDCGVKGPKLSQVALENELSGFEFMIGFPGSVGGNIYMNASANSQTISDFLLSINVFDLNKKEVLHVEKKTLEFAYRTSILQKMPYILLSAEFELQKANKEQIESHMKKNLEFRTSHQPTLSLPNAGSIFKNPDDDSAGRLLDKAGARDFKNGGAKVWENHANFIVNTGDATSSDVIELMFKMYMAVKDKFNIRLKPEVRFFGEKTQREEDICNIMYN